MYICTVYIYIYTYRPFTAFFCTKCWYVFPLVHQVISPAKGILVTWPGPNDFDPGAGKLLPIFEASQVPGNLDG